MSSAVRPRSASSLGGAEASPGEGTLPLLWIFGPPGVGKTTVAWQIFTELQQSGTNSAFVDIDQMGIRSPEPADDPGSHRVKVANLAAVVDNHRRAGAQCVVVSGVIDAENGVDDGLLPDVVIQWVRLRADRTELTRRLRDRGETHDDVDDVWREAELLDANAGADELVIDTTDLDLDEVVRQVRRCIAPWPRTAPPDEAAQDSLPPTTRRRGREPAGNVLWLCGTTAVGKSAVGFNIFLRQLRAGSPTAFVDLDQVGFIGPDARESLRHQVKAANLSALWANFSVAGTTHLVVVGSATSAADIDVCRKALPAATFYVVRLDAEPEELGRRIRLRSQGQGWAQPGDPLRGQPTETLTEIIHAARAESEALVAAGIGDIAVDTTALSVDQVAESVLLQGAWPTDVTGRA